MDIQKMLREAEQLQKNLNKVQEELAGIEVEGAAGGGLVQVKLTAQGAIKDIKIKKEAVNPEDVETLEDLILSALNDGTSKAVEISQKKIGKLTGGMGGPGMGLPGM